MNGIIKKIGLAIVQVLMAIIMLIGLFYLHIYETKPIYIPLKKIS